jgi:hypothetical protein
MLYPDLCRLSLLRPTGANNDDEASGSNDPLPPPPSQRARVDPDAPAAETGQEAVLRQQELLQLILLSVADGDFQTLCTAAVRWCSLNNPHRGMCDEGVWKALTKKVFPNAREPIGYRRGHLPEPTHPKGWFVYLCKQHKKLRDLQREWAPQAVSIEDYALDVDRDLARARADEARLTGVAKTLSTLRWQLGRNSAFEHIRAALLARIEANRRAVDESANRIRDAYSKGAQSRPFYNGRLSAEESEWMLRRIDKQESYIRELEPDPAANLASLEAEVERRRRIALESMVSNDMRHERAERARVKEDALLEEKQKKWLADQEAKDRRDAVLSVTMERARVLLVRTRNRHAGKGQWRNVSLQLGKLEQERANWGSFSNRPAVMERLARGLREAMDALEH